MTQQQVVIVLPRVEPKTSSNAPYTLGYKKTKTKMSWGTDSPDAGSSTGICAKSQSVAVSYQSRWYDRKTDKPYTIEIDGSYVYQRFSNRDRILIAEIQEDRTRTTFIKWRISLSESTSVLMERVSMYLAIGVENPTHSQALRHTLPQSSHQLSDVAVKRKIVKIGADGSVDLGSAEWKGTADRFKKPSVSKSKRDRAKAAIKMY